MYKIIGADQKEYGPITVEQLRYWIAEGRINASTQARAEGTTEWKPLGSFVEFAEALGLDPQTVSSGGYSAQTSGLDEARRAAALQAVKGPAIALKVTAVLGLVMVFLGLVMNIMALAGHPVTFGMEEMGDVRMQKLFSQIGGGVGIVQGLIGGVLAVVIFMGASKMQALTNYQYAFTASIIAMVPCVSPCCLLGLPFGIWALVVLSKPENKSQFT